MPNIETSRQRAKEQKLQAHRISDTEYVVYNPTSKSQYSVLRSKSGTWYCTCPFATKSNRVSSTEICKHLARILDKEEGCVKCHDKIARLDSNRECANCRLLDRMGF